MGVGFLSSVCSPSLQLVMRDAEQLHRMIANTSDLAEKVSSKVRTLDLVKVWFPSKVNGSQLQFRLSSYNVITYCTT